MKRFLPIFAAAFVLVGGAAYMLMPTRGGDGLPQLGAANAQTAEAAVEIVDMTLGNPDANVTIIEYASYTCPHCKNFHTNQFKTLKSEYIDTGKVNFIYREVYFDRPGLWASMVARCGGQERFFGITDLIYERHPGWLGSGDGMTIIGDLRKIGKVAGLSDEELDVCMSDADTAGALYQWFQTNAEADNITSTPSFVINGTKYTNMSHDEFRAILDPLIEG